MQLLRACEREFRRVKERWRFKTDPNNAREHSTLRRFHYQQEKLLCDENGHHARVPRDVMPKFEAARWDQNPNILEAVESKKHRHLAV